MQRLLYQLRGNAMRDAAGLMAWRGYDNVRASELARAARMSVGTLYRQYGSKRAFALAVRDFMDQELSQYGAHHFQWARGEPEADFRSAFLALWSQLAQGVLNQPALFCFTFLHWHPEDLQQPQAQVTRARAMLREVLTEGERDGALAPGAARLGEGLVWGALTELARTLAQGAEEVYQEDIEESGEALLRALAPREGAGPRGGGDTSSGGAGPEVPVHGGGEADSMPWLTEAPRADSPLADAVELRPQTLQDTRVAAVPALSGAPVAASTLASAVEFRAQTPQDTRGPPRPGLPAGWSPTHPWSLMPRHPAVPRAPWWLSALPCLGGPGAPRSG